MRESEGKKNFNANDSLKYKKGRKNGTWCKSKALVCRLISMIIKSKVNYSHNHPQFNFLSTLISQCFLPSSVRSFSFSFLTTLATTLIISFSLLSCLLQTWIQRILLFFGNILIRHCVFLVLWRRMEGKHKSGKLMLAISISITQLCIKFTEISFWHSSLIFIFFLFLFLYILHVGRTLRFIVPRSGNRLASAYIYTSKTIKMMMMMENDDKIPYNNEHKRG